MSKLKEVVEEVKEKKKGEEKNLYSEWNFSIHPM